MKSLVHSKIAPGDGITAPLRVVLSKTAAGFATHIENVQLNGTVNGRYFDSFEEAAQDFGERAREIGVPTQYYGVV